MPAATTVEELIRYADHIGCRVETSDTPSDLYALVTPPPDGHVLYLGKDESALGRRAANEARWAELDPEKWELSGIITLIRRNNGKHVHLALKGFDVQKALESGKDWGGDIPALTADDFVWTVQETEKLLIRIAVRLGVPIGNSQFASQWEYPIGKMHDRLAVWAVTAEPFPADRTST